MGRPITLLVLVIGVACAALFALLPLSKIDQRVAPTNGTRDPAPSTTEQVPSGRAGPDRVAAKVAPAAVAPAEPVVTVRGQVSDDLGAPVPGLDISLQSQGFDGQAATPVTTISDRLGQFNLQLVPGLQYRLEIMASENHAGFSLDALNDQTSDALQNIVLERVERVDVDSMIVDTNRAPVANFELVLHHLNLEIPERVIRSDSSGYFSLRGIPAGQWRAATRASNYFRIQGLELMPGAYRNLTLVVDRGSYHLSGWVRDRNGLPLAGVLVTLKSAFATDGYHSSSYRSVASDDHGAFEFANLGGKQMTLGVYANGFESFVQQYEFASFSDIVEIELQDSPDD